MLRIGVNNGLGHASPKMLKKYIKADSLEVVEKLTLKRCSLWFIRPASLTVPSNAS